MKLYNFIQSLLPSLKKSQIIEDCRIAKSEILETTQPSYAAAIEVLGDWNFKSDELSSMLSQFSRMVKGERNDNPIVTIHKSFITILMNLEHIEKEVTKEYGDEAAGMGFTYRKANVLQLVEMFTFVSKFARKFLIYVYICETEEYKDSGTKLKDSLSPIEIKWLKDNFVSFCTVLNIVRRDPKAILISLDQIPDIVITADNVETLPHTVGENKIDPFQVGLIPVWLNPIYHIGLFVAEWQVNRYKAAKEEAILLSLRKMNLEKLVAKEPDAKLQKEIDYIEGRIQSLNYKIHQLEK